MPLPPDPVEIRGGCNCGAIRYKIKVPSFEERPIHFTFPSAAKSDPATPRLPLVATDLCNDCRSATASILPAWILCPGDFFTISCLPRSADDDGAAPAGAREQLHKRPLVNRAAVFLDDTSDRPAFVPAYEMLSGRGVSSSSSSSSAAPDTWLQLYVSTDEETNHKTGRDSFRSFCGRCGTNLAYTVRPMPPGMPDMIDVVLGTVDRELLAQEWMRPERHLWWRYGIPWVQELLMGGLPAPRHPIYSVHDVVEDNLGL